MTRNQLPGNYIRSHTGVVAYVKVSGDRVVGHGRKQQRVKMVRLQFVGSGVTGQPMPLSDLLKPDVKWFRRKPRKVVSIMEVAR